MNRLQRAVVWIGMNAFFGWCMWHGFVNGHEGMRNVATFLVWFTFVTTVLAWLMPSVCEKLRAKGHSMPGGVVFLYETFMVATLIWTGAWLLGGVYAVQACLESSIFFGKTD